MLGNMLTGEEVIRAEKGDVTALREYNNMDHMDKTF